ncbi:MAG TPA: hypothetical protein VGD69_03130 [Herpetosiphonaceae bacterium]
MCNTEINTLPYWWWPGQWLRIVYAVWVDQRWYWEHVRPRINSSKQAVALVIQGLLGTTLVVLLLTIGIGGISTLVGAPVHWNGITTGLVTGALFGLLASGGERVAGTVAIGIGIGVLWGVSSILGLSGSEMIAKVSARSFVPGAALCMMYALVWGGIIGLALSIAEVVTKGILWTSSTSLRLAVLIGAIIIIGPFLLVPRLAAIPTYTTVLALIASVLICSSLACGFLIGMGAGGRWATRQVADEAERIRLAQPESSSA